jgi:uncharacterized protein YeeX (DUF496 family)
VAGWKDMLLDVLRLTDEVKRMNRDIDRVESTLSNVDKRVVRLETLVEVAQVQMSRPKIESK